MTEFAGTCRDCGREIASANNPAAWKDAVFKHRRKDCTPKVRAQMSRECMDRTFAVNQRLRELGISKPFKLER